MNAAAKRKGRAAIDLLAPDPLNPRRIDAQALAGLGASLAHFGDLGGIVWNERSGHLVAGHQRLDALRKAGATSWTRGAESYVEHPATRERFPVRVVDWDAATERAANLTANNPAIQGTFTADALAQLASIKVDFSAFKDVCLDSMLTNLPAQA